MATATEKLIPLVSSGTAGPLGVLHLPSLWAKLSLNAHGMLADGYDFRGNGFDQMTLDAVGLKRDATLTYFAEQHPTYMQFERYVLDHNGGAIAKDKIDAHNAAVRGYEHAEELGSAMRTAYGNEHAHVKDAVTLNGLEDLDALHAQLEATH